MIIAYNHVTFLFKTFSHIPTHRILYSRYHQHPNVLMRLWHMSHIILIAWTTKNILKTNHNCSVMWTQNYVYDVHSILKLFFQLFIMGHISQLNHSIILYFNFFALFSVTSKLIQYLSDLHWLGVSFPKFSTNLFHN